jgi:hypothetical protein
MTRDDVAIAIVSIAMVALYVKMSGGNVPIHCSAILSYVIINAYFHDWQLVSVMPDAVNSLCLATNRWRNIASFKANIRRTSLERLSLKITRTGLKRNTFHT